MWIGVLYFLIKGAAYCGWCGLGVRRFRPERTAWIGPALGLGLLRLLMGLGFGVLIFFAGLYLYAGLGETGALGVTTAMTLTYLAVYVPVRWIEWGIIEALLAPPARTLSGFLLGSSGTGRSWRLGGIAISCLADLPLILSAGGLPVGRFMC